MEILNVKLQNSSYDVFIQPGLLQNAGELISQWYKGLNIAVITDNNVDVLYGNDLITCLQQCNYNVTKIVVPPGEQSKSLKMLDYIYCKLAEAGITRDSLIIAFGGGVIGDLTGFAAATFMRGVPYVQIPTTVMSQLDSSIGGKTAVNITAGKNLAGCFYQPRAVYIDTCLLETLPDKEFADGMAEAVKYGAIKDEELFSKLHAMKSLKDARANIVSIIYKCAAIKSHIVSIDEFDKGERMLLNFGHTIGHGIEKYYNYETYTHGEAVAIGMSILTKRSEALGITKPGTAQALIETLVTFGLPVNNDGIDIDKLLRFIRLDKKSAESYAKLILLKEIGNAFIYKTTKDDLINFIC